MDSNNNAWLDILREAWSDLIYDYRKFGELNGYGHTREEDIRSFLFCKIMNLLRKNNMFLINLHTEMPLVGKKRADIVLGVTKDGWEVGVEIKRVGKLQTIKSDLDKLRNFMEKKKIEAGVLLVIAKHSANLREMFRQNIDTVYKLEQTDNRNNNFTEWNNIKIDEYNIDWDTLFLVLRTL